MQRAPEVSVVVASHGRPDRLAILLDALAGQTLARERWELVLAHTYDAATTERIVDSHPLSAAGVLRQVRVDPAGARPSAQRNAALAVAAAPAVAFTDDDCRPEPDWLERLLARHAGDRDAIVQGATWPDPNDLDRIGIPLYLRTVYVLDPPGEFPQTCNILYARELLERVGGFDERAITAEDIDLGLRACQAGSRLVGAPDAVVYHAAEGLSFAERWRAGQKWQHVAYVVRKNPELRRRCTWGIFWTRGHAAAALALAGVLLAPARPIAAVAAFPYYLVEATHFGELPRERLRAVRRLPQLWAAELAEMAIFARGSVRYRTLLL